MIIAPSSGDNIEGNLTDYGISNPNNIINPSPENDFFDFNTAHNIIPIEQILTEKVYEGGKGENSRFRRISRVAGHYISRWHKGELNLGEAVNAIHGYNLLKVIPSWPQEKLNQTINSLRNNHLKKYGEPTAVRNYNSYHNDNTNSSDINTSPHESDASKQPLIFGNAKFEGLEQNKEDLLEKSAVYLNHLIAIFSKNM